MSELYGPDGKALPASVRAAARARLRISANASGGSSGTPAWAATSRTHPALANWRPPLWHAASALTISRPAIQARVSDLVRNDGWASSAVSRYVTEMVGGGWRLSAKPIARILGLTPEEAEDVADQIESHWAAYAAPGHLDADAERTHPVSGLIGLAMRQMIEAGEAFGIVTAREDNVQALTCLHLIDSDRVANPTGRRDDATLRDGVEMDSYGAPVAYHVRKAHPSDFARIADAFTFERVPRRTADGRPVMLHAFQPLRPGDRRGVSRFAPIVRKLRQITQFDDVELQAATLNAVMATFITSPFDPEAAAESLNPAAGVDYNAARAAWAQGNPMDLGEGVRIASLYAGEEVTTLKPEHPNANFTPFVNAALRNIASSVGLTYEQMTMDWSQVNYSSARAALLVIYRAFDADRDGFAGRFMQPWYMAWLEEMVETGRIVLPSSAPSFAEAPHAWCHAEWVGPGRGWVDPMKEAQAAAYRVGAGLSTLEAEAAQQGRDWREDAQQRAREARYLAALGLPAPGDAPERIQIVDTSPSPPASDFDDEDNEGVSP
jgi:lambda family phage portal protein